MADVKTWSDLSEGQRNAIKVLALTEFTLKILMLIDIRRRPASQIRGPKAAWRAAAAVNTIGPVSYFLFGRRKAGSS
jgi:phospholipase D-like protein